VLTNRPREVSSVGDYCAFAESSDDDQGLERTAPQAV